MGKKKVVVDKDDDGGEGGGAPVVKLAKEAAKKKKRVTKQDRAGLYVNVTRCKRFIKEHWKGRVSTETAVALAAFLQYVSECLLASAAAAATRLGGESTRINSGHVQTAITENAWLRKSGLVRGRVLGAAPITRTVSPLAAAAVDDEQE